MINIRNLKKTFGSQMILNEVSLSIKQGEVAAIIGPSGGGKSTLLRCVNGLETFQSGSIQVDGLTLESESVKQTESETLLQLRRKVGMVFQQFNLFPHMNVLDNVLAGPRYVLGKVTEATIQEAKELLKRVGLSEKESARPQQLSGGQQQRVAIARALAVHPSAMLFDEPTSALDPRMANEVLSVMTDLARQGLTMMVVTHAMGFARKVAHTVYLMSAGKVAEFGPPEQIFNDPREAVTRDFLSQIHAA
jgi:ABC-type polar amino acid transport system ATPase subunit